MSLMDLTTRESIAFMLNAGIYGSIMRKTLYFAKQKHICILSS
jgi:hypothetical protein